MTLVVSDSKPQLDVKAFGEIVFLSTDDAYISVPMDEFVRVMWYVITNADVEPNDPRMCFVELMKKIQLVEGYNIQNDKESKRLGIDENTNSFRMPVEKCQKI
jgi:hypothetical protein